MYNLIESFEPLAITIACLCSHKYSGNLMVFGICPVYIKIHVKHAASVNQHENIKFM